MKNIKYIISLIAIVMLASCEPQMDQAPELGSMPSGDFTITDSGEGANYKVLEVNASDAFLYTWVLGNGEKAEGNKVTAYYPFKGDYTVTCTMSGKAGAISVEKSITVDATDPALAEKPGFKELTGSGLGKMWIYDAPTVPENDGVPGYLYMTANYDWEEFWWNPYNAEYGHPTRDFFSKMKFDLDGGYNYTLIEEDGTETKGTFLLNMEDMTLQIIDTHIPDYDEENCDPDVTATGVYQVKILEDGKLFLWQDQSALNPDDFDYGWAWVFVPEAGGE